MTGRGFFISFEGGDGAGKTTQIARLYARLQQAGRDVVRTREPGGSPEAETIRNILLRRSGGDWTPVAELLLAFTARHMHTETLIKPSLDSRKIVLSDRYTDSSYVYQILCNDLPDNVYEQVKEVAIGNFMPDLTFILDIDPALGIRRAKNFNAAQNDATEKNDDRFEGRDLSFHTRVREGFLKIARENPQRCVVIDAAQPVDNVADNIWMHVQTRLGIS